MLTLLLKIKIKALYLGNVEDLRKGVLNRKAFVRKEGSFLDMSIVMTSSMTNMFA